MENSIFQHAAEILKVVAHPTRLRIVAVLEEGEKTVGQIVALTGARQAVISQHLNLMRDKGVLARRRQGARVFYRIENENVISVLHCIYHHCATKQGVQR